MTRPLFCPNCGASLTDPYSAVHLAADETPTAAGVWDTYCAACEWSGDIWPDKESGGAEVVQVEAAPPGRTFHVDPSQPNAADAPDHGTREAPFATVAYALECAKANSSLRSSIALIARIRAPKEGW